jgi:hypothetical protein
MTRSELAEQILINWCANPQMFAEGAHVPYANLIEQAYAFADQIVAARPLERQMYQRSAK